MKSEKGVTLTSIMIYVIAMTTAVLVVGRLITYFYKNIDLVSSNTAAASEYTKFNSFFTNEINTKGNEVEECANDYILFSKTQNQYTFKNGNIYLNKIRISKDIKSCQFIYDKAKEIITVNLNIADKDYSVLYTIVK